MTPQLSARLRQQLKRDEGTVLHAYPDHLGFLTIGTGRLIDQRKGGGLSAAEADYLLDNDIQRVQAQVLQALPWVASLPPARQGVLFNMAFQMGKAGLLKFVTTLRLVQAGDFKGAAQQMQRSLWARQTPERAARLSKQMETGEWQ
jgi:lysozyme